MNPSAHFCGRPRCTTGMMMLWYQEARPTKTCCGTIAAEMIRHDRPTFAWHTGCLSQDTYRPSRYQAHCRKQNSFSLLSLTNKRDAVDTHAGGVILCCFSHRQGKSEPRVTHHNDDKGLDPTAAAAASHWARLSFSFPPFHSFPPPHRRSSEFPPPPPIHLRRTDGLDIPSALHRTYPFTMNRGGVLHFLQQKKGWFSRFWGFGGCVCFFFARGRI